MTISDFQILNCHIGYGSQTPEIIFIGLEEGCEESEMNENYKYRIGNIGSPLLSLQSFHLRSGLQSLTKWFNPPYPIQRTWNLYCQVALSYLGCTIISSSMRRNYMVNNLGSLCGITALVELYPLPRPRHNYWHKSLAVPHLFTSRKEYIKYCRTNNYTRINAIISLINNPKHRATIIHGGLRQSNVMKHILKMFPALSFVKDHSFTKKIIKEYRLGNQKVFISYFFSTRNYTLDDMYHLGKIL